MPFKSESQRRFLWLKHPDIAKRWAHEYPNQGHLPKKVGKAHQRNAIRRRLRVITQKHGDRINGDRYLVTIARWRAAEATLEELEKDWLRLAKRLEIID